MTLPQHDENDELALFRDMVVRFIEQEVTPNFDQWEEKHTARSSG